MPAGLPPIITGPEGLSQQAESFLNQIRRQFYRWFQNPKHPDPKKKITPIYLGKYLQLLRLPRCNHCLRHPCMEVSAGNTPAAAAGQGQHAGASSSEAGPSSPAPAAGGGSSTAPAADGSAPAPSTVRMWRLEGGTPGLPALVKDTGKLDPANLLTGPTAAYYCDHAACKAAGEAAAAAAQRAAAAAAAGAAAGASSSAAPAVALVRVEVPREDLIQRLTPFSSLFTFMPVRV
jgi:hypothetical protein